MGMCGLLRNLLLLRLAPVSQTAVLKALTLGQFRFGRAYHEERLAAGTSVRRGSIGNRIRCPTSAFIVGNRPQPDNQSVGQTGNGQSGIVDKALPNAEFVRTISGKDTDAVLSDFHFIEAAVFSFDGKGTRFCLPMIQRNTHKQIAVLIDFCDIGVTAFGGKQETDQASHT